MKFNLPIPKITKIQTKSTTLNQSHPKLESFKPKLNSHPTRKSSNLSTYLPLNSIPNDFTKFIQLLSIISRNHHQVLITNLID